MAAPQTNARNIQVDNRLDAYQSFFPHACVRRLNEFARGTALDPLLFDLWVGWRGVSNAHMLPWLSIVSAKGVADGGAEHHLPGVERLVGLIRQKVFDEVAPHLDGAQRDRLSGVFDGFAANLEKARGAAMPTLDREEIWRQYLTTFEFQMGVWGCQRLCFNGLYYAYEDFLLQAYRAAGDAQYRLKNADDFGRRFKVTFGAELEAYCWSHPEVEVARVVRNALVHCGGRETSKVREHRHCFTVLDGQLQVMAHHTRMLNELLLDRIERFVWAAVRSKFTKLSTQQAA